MSSIDLQKLRRRAVVYALDDIDKLIAEVEQLRTELRCANSRLAEDPDDDISDVADSARAAYDGLAIVTRRIHEHVAVLCAASGLDVGT